MTCKSTLGSWVVLIGLVLAGCGKESQTTSSAAPKADEQVAGGDTPKAASSARLPEAALAAWQGFARKQCEQAGLLFAAPGLVPYSGFERTPNGFLQADFNADGRPDFVVITPSQGCGEEGPADYGAQGGPPADFVISTADGYRAFQGFGGWIEGDMVQRRTDRDVLRLPWNRSGRCGPVSVVTWGWDGKGVSILERRNPSGALVDADGCVQEAVRPAATASTLPVRTGYYAVNEPDCTAALRSSDGGVVIDGQYLRDIDGDYSLLPAKSLGGNTYRLGEAFEKVRVTGPASFIAEEGTPYQRRFQWCAEKAPA